MVKILDCTCRDGGHQNNWNFEYDFVKNHIAFCVNSGVDLIEIGYRNYKESQGKGKIFRCDQNLCKNFYSFKQNLEFGVMADTSRINIEDFPEAKSDYLDFIRLACHPDRISETLEISEILYKRGYKVFVQLMEIPNLFDSHYKILEEWENKNILESLYIADSYGTAKPENIKQYFDKLNNIGYDRISFHAHNNSGFALENTLCAIESGAYSIDGSLNGMGGNPDIEKILKIVKK